MDSLPNIEQIIINTHNFFTVKPTDEYIQTFLSNLPATKREFFFRPCHLLTDKTLKLVAEKLPNLETIILQGCFQFTEIGLRAIVALPNLKALYMQGVQRIPEDVQKKVLESKPGLTFHSS